MLSVRIQPPSPYYRKPTNSSRPDGLEAVKRIGARIFDRHMACRGLSLRMTSDGVITGSATERMALAGQGVGDVS